MIYNIVLKPLNCKSMRLFFTITLEKICYELNKDQELRNDNVVRKIYIDRPIWKQLAKLSITDDV